MVVVEKLWQCVVLLLLRQQLASGFQNLYFIAYSFQLVFKTLPNIVFHSFWWKIFKLKKGGGEELLLDALWRSRWCRSNDHEILRFVLCFLREAFCDVSEVGIWIPVWVLLASSTSSPFLLLSFWVWKAEVEICWSPNYWSGIIMDQRSDRKSIIYLVIYSFALALYPSKTSFFIFLLLHSIW